jgi:GH25 family lysozyme M1 (1,4-beta-N-acetylmuramidase)
MKFAPYLSTLALLAATSEAVVQGFDISHYQPTVNFASAYAGGLRFVYIKATEGTTYTDSSVRTLSPRHESTL